MSEDINFGAITEALNDKADRDLNNTNPVADYVVERYDDEQGNWYEVWKSGYISQGGKTASSTNVTVTFLKPFSKVNSVLCVKNRGSAKENPISVASYSNTTAVFQSSGDGAPVIWRAEGQGA